MRNKRINIGVVITMVFTVAIYVLNVSQHSVCAKSKAASSRYTNESESQNSQIFNVKMADINANNGNNSTTLCLNFLEPDTTIKIKTGRNQARLITSSLLSSNNDDCVYQNVKLYGAEGDGTTDDADSIQAVITSSADSGEAAFITNGIFVLGTNRSALDEYTRLAMANNTSLIGNGSSSILKNVKSGSGISRMVEIYSDTTVILANLKFIADTSSYKVEGDHCVAIHNSKDVWIINCEFYCASDAITIQGSSENIFIIGCKMHGDSLAQYTINNDYAARNGISVVGNCKNITIADNQFFGFRVGQIDIEPSAGISGICENILINGNIFDNFFGYRTNLPARIGAAVDIVSNQEDSATVLRKILVENNIFSNSKRAGVELWGAPGKVENITISGNSFINMVQDDSVNYPGAIHILQKCSDILVSDNIIDSTNGYGIYVYNTNNYRNLYNLTIENNQILNSEADAIHIRGSQANDNVYGVSIINNIIDNAGNNGFPLADSLLYYGLKIRDCNNVAVKNNRVECSVSADSAKYSAIFASCDTISIVGNDFLAGAVARYTWMNLSSMELAHNNTGSTSTPNFHSSIYTSPLGNGGLDFFKIFTNRGTIGDTTGIMFKTLAGDTTFFVDSWGRLFLQPHYSASDPTPLSEGTIWVSNNGDSLFAYLKNAKQRLWPVKNQKCIWNVKDYGAIGNGVANDTAPIQECIDDAISNLGGTVYFPPGDYNISQIKIKNGNNVKLQFDGAILKSGFLGTTGSDSAKTMIYIEGNIDSVLNASVTTDIVTGSNKAIVDSTTEISVGDHLYIATNETLGSMETTIKRGFHAIVTKAIQDSVWFDTVFPNSMEADSVTGIYYMYDLDGIKIDGLEANLSAKNHQAIAALYTNNIEIMNCRVYGRLDSSYIGISVSYSYRPHIHHNYVRGFYYPGYGYGISISASNICDVYLNSIMLCTSGLSGGSGVMNGFSYFFHKNKVNDCESGISFHDGIFNSSIYDNEIYNCTAAGRIAGDNQDFIMNRIANSGAFSITSQCKTTAKYRNILNNKFFSPQINGIGYNYTLINCRIESNEFNDFNYYPIKQSSSASIDSSSICYNQFRNTASSYFCYFYTVTNSDISYNQFWNSEGMRFYGSVVNNTINGNKAYNVKNRLIYWHLSPGYNLVAYNFVDSGNLFSQGAGYGSIKFMGNIDGDTNYYGINTNNPQSTFQVAGGIKADSIAVGDDEWLSQISTETTQSRKWLIQVIDNDTCFIPFYTQSDTSGKW